MEAIHLETSDLTMATASTVLGDPNSDFARKGNSAWLMLFAMNHRVHTINSAEDGAGVPTATTTAQCCNG